MFIRPPCVQFLKKKTKHICAKPPLDPQVLRAADTSEAMWRTRAVRTAFAQVVKCVRVFLCELTFQGVLIRRDREDRCCFGCKGAFPRLRVSAVWEARERWNRRFSEPRAQFCLGTLCVSHKKKKSTIILKCLASVAVTAADMHGRG